MRRSAEPGDSLELSIGDTHHACRLLAVIELADDAIWFVEAKARKLLVRASRLGDSLARLRIDDAMDVRVAVLDDATASLDAETFMGATFDQEGVVRWQPA